MRDKPAQSFDHLLQKLEAEDSDTQLHRTIPDAARKGHAWVVPPLLEEMLDDRTRNSCNYTDIVDVGLRAMADAARTNSFQTVEIADTLLTHCPDEFCRAQIQDAAINVLLTVAEQNVDDASRLMRHLARDLAIDIARLNLLRGDTPDGRPVLIFMPFKPDMAIAVATRHDDGDIKLMTGAFNGTKAELTGIHGDTLLPGVVTQLHLSLFKKARKLMDHPVRQPLPEALRIRADTYRSYFPRRPDHIATSASALSPTQAA